MVHASAITGSIHIQPRKDRKIVKKADLVDSRTQKPLKLRNKGLLSLDGGGLRGLLTGIVLEEAERAVKTVIAEDNLLPIHCRGLSPEQWGIELADYFECVSGTSAGSMLALYIASKGGNTFHNVQDQLPADGQAHVTLVEGSVAVAWRVIKLRAKSIFTPPWQLFLRFRLTDWFRALFPFGSGFFWAKYSALGVDETLKTLMGTNLKLSDLHTSVVIPSYELESSSPFTFWHKHSASAEESQTGFVAMLRADDVAGLDATSMVGGVQFVKGRDFKLWEVARASSAAPTYFPAAFINTTPDEPEPSMRTFVDGGLIANNPTIQGLSFMIGEMGWDMDSIAVLSVGTGSAVRDLRKETLREGQWGWGMLEWILPNKGNIINTIQDGSSEASQAIVEVLFALRHGPARSADKPAKPEHSRLLRIQKTVDDARNAKQLIGKDGMTLSDAVEALSEIDNIKDVDKLVQIGQNLARDSRGELQDFVRHSLLCAQ